MQTYNYLFLSLVALSLAINYVACDLKQANDKIEQHHPSSDDQQDDHQLPEEVSPSDPERLKRELKEIIRRRIDLDKDNVVSFEEIKKYLAELHDETIEYNVDKQWTVYSPQVHEVFSWQGYEPEKKEVLTWDHYFNQTYPELIGIDVGVPINREQDTSRVWNQKPDESQEKEKEKKEKTEEDVNEDPHLKSLKLMVARADARWKLADENGDTLLTKDEFKFLLHPDEGCEELQNLFVQEATEDMDMNKDGKICLDEFMKHLQVLASEQERTDQGWLSNQQENFGRFLDKNKDGVLDKEEIREWLVPPKTRKFETEAKRLLDIGDTNEDHGLSVVEILDHFDQYLSLLPPEYWAKQKSSMKAEESPEERHVYTDEEVGHEEL